MQGLLQGPSTSMVVEAEILCIEYILVYLNCAEACIGYRIPWVFGVPRQRTQSCNMLVSILIHQLSSEVKFLSLQQHTIACGLVLSPDMGKGIHTWRGSKVPVRRCHREWRSCKANRCHNVINRENKLITSSTV